MQGLGLPSKLASYHNHCCLTHCSGQIEEFVSNLLIQVNLDMTDSMGPGKLVRLMQNLSYT